MGKSKKRSKRSSNSSSCSSDEREEKKLKRLKKKLKKEQKKAEKALRKKIKAENKYSTLHKKDGIQNNECINPSSNIPLDLMNKSKNLAPMTKEEWDKRQSVVRRIVDEETGRSRLVKGDGEILEEIVSKNRHKQINHIATKSDGDFFQSKTVGKLGYQ